MPASTLALAPAGDPTSPRRLVSVSPRRQLAPGPSLNPEADEPPIVLAAGNEQDGAGASCGPGWSTKLQAILDELDFVNREHPGEKEGRLLTLALSQPQQKGDFVWRTYDQVFTDIKNASKGLYSLPGIADKRMQRQQMVAAVLAKTSQEWMIFAQLLPTIS